MLFIKMEVACSLRFVLLNSRIEEKFRSSSMYRFEEHK